MHKVLGDSKGDVSCLGGSRKVVISELGPKGQDDVTVKKR